MLYRFRSKSSADVIALQSTGDALLRAMGREPARKGIVEAPNLAAAIRSIEQAIEREEASLRQPVPLGAGAQDAACIDDPEEDCAKPQAVSLRQRAWPLLEMLRRAQAHGDVVTWG